MDIYFEILIYTFVPHINYDNPLFTFCKELYKLTFNYLHSINFHTIT